MVSSMRKALKRPLFRDIVVWSAVLSLSLFYTVPELIRRLSTPEGIMNVDNVAVAPEQFQAEVNIQQRKISNIYSQYGESANFILKYSGLSSDPTEMAYKVLVRQALIDSVARKYNLKIDEELLNEQLFNMLPPGAVSEDGRLNFPLEFVEELRRNLRNEIIGKMVLDFARASAYVPEFLVKSGFKDKYSKRNYSILTFSYEDYLKAAKGKKATDKELLAYYSKNKANYFVEEKRDGKVWNFSAADYGIQIKDEDVKKHYERNKPKYKDKAAEVKVARILIKHSPDAGKKADSVHAETLKNTTNFAELAKKHSEDKDSAEKGGELAFFKRGDKTPEFEGAAFALSKENPVSDVVKTEDGYEILKFVGKKNATFKPLKDVEGDIKLELQKEKFKRLFPINARKAINSNAKGSELASFKQKGKQGITYSQMPKGSTKDIKKLFKLKAKGDAGFFVEGDAGVLVQLESISKAHTSPLKDIKDKVEADYYKDKALSALKSDVEKAKKEAGSTPLSKLKAKFKADEREIKDISPSDSTVLSTLAGQGVPAYKMIGLQLENSVLADASEKGGFVVKMTKMAPLDNKQFEDNKTEIKRGLQQMQDQILPEGFIASLKKDAKISINDDRLKNQLKDLL